MGVKLVAERYHREGLEKGGIKLEKRKRLDFFLFLFLALKVS